MFIQMEYNVYRDLGKGKVYATGDLLKNNFCMSIIVVMTRRFLVQLMHFIGFFLLFARLCIKRQSNEAIRKGPFSLKKMFLCNFLCEINFSREFSNNMSVSTLRLAFSTCKYNKLSLLLCCFQRRDFSSSMLKGEI